jgi:alpha-galactosidase
MTRKLVLLGAGSAMFTKGMVADLIRSPEMGQVELCLVDIDPIALETVAGLAERMIAARGGNVTIRTATDRRDLLPNADLVVSVIGVGGRRAWETDAYLPRKYGIFQPVGDSVMPGGISRAMRMIPALVAVAEDIKQLAPNARFFNFANPLTANCWAVRKATGVEVAGLCHGVFHIERQLAEFIGAPPEEVSSLAVGLNHLTFFTDLRWKGEDAWPLVREKLAHERANPPADAKPGDTFATPFRAANNPFSWSIFERYGAYPSASDRHVTEFFPERFPQGRYDGMQLGIDAFSVEDVIKWGDDIYADMRAQATGAAPLDESVFDKAVGEHEQFLAILRSIDLDERKVFSINLPNQGAVPNLPADAVLEMPVAATASGLRPLAMHDFPNPLAALLQRKIAATRVTVEAALAGSRDLFYEALLLDGAVTDMETAQALGDELLEAQRAHLPNFFS